MKNFNNIGAYLAGLFEGDGTIYIPTALTLRKKQTNARVSIAFNIKDINQAEAIIQGIGYGYLTRIPKRGACKITITQVKGLRVFLDLVKPYIRTPKYIQINNLITWLNKNHNDNRSLITCVNLTELLENSWLSGFIDADGNFYIRNTKKEAGNTKDRIVCRLKIEQKEIYDLNTESFRNLFDLYAEVLSSKVKSRTQKRSAPSLILEITKFVILEKLIKYFDNYRLYSSKYYDYEDWKKAYQLLKNKEAYSVEGRAQILKLKNQMNNQRLKGITKDDVQELTTYLRNQYLDK
ncbi:hypothetical protein ACTFIW_000192 (mitochondrion) [Dictyostelium discoideum]